MEELDASALTGHMLMGLQDPHFAGSMIYICAHSSEGAMGLIINRLFGEIRFFDLLEQMGIDHKDGDDIHVHYGGPVELGRGFVLHSTDFVREGTLVVEPRFALTGTLDIVHALARGEGPRRKLFTLGYTGWGPGQLENEIRNNGWHDQPADPDILFTEKDNEKWPLALECLGIYPDSLVETGGNA